MDENVILYTTWPDAETAESLAAEALERRLAACVNILGPVTSLYRWEGAVERASETPMILKTTGRAAPALRALIEAHHPYASPCIVGLRLDPGASSPSFMDWIKTETASPQNTEI